MKKKTSSGFYGNNYQILTIDKDVYIFQEPATAAFEEEIDEELLKNYYTKEQTNDALLKTKQEIIDDVLNQMHTMWVSVTVKVNKEMDLNVSNDQYNYQFNGLTEDKTFYLPTDGIWTFTNSSDGSEAKTVVETEPYKHYEVFIDSSHVLGIVWDYSVFTTECTRLTPETDPLGVVTDTVPYETEVAWNDKNTGSSYFDDISPWKDMVPVNVEDCAYTYKMGEKGFSFKNETVVPIVKFYYKVVDDAENSKRYWYVSSKKIDGFSVHPGSGRAVSRYWIDEDCNSVSGQLPYASNWDRESQSASNTDTAKYLYTYEAKIKEKISENNSGQWACLDVATYEAILLLMLIEFADFGIKEKFFEGYENRLHSRYAIGLGDQSSKYNTPIENGSLLDEKQYGTAWQYDLINTTSNISYSAFQYRWIENLGGANGLYLAGFRVVGKVTDDAPAGSFYICIDPSKNNIPLDQASCYAYENPASDLTILTPEESGYIYSYNAIQYGNGYPTKLSYFEDFPWHFHGNNADGKRSIGGSLGLTCLGDYQTKYYGFAGITVDYACASDVYSPFSWLTAEYMGSREMHSMFTPTGSWVPTDDEED